MGASYRSWKAEFIGKGGGQDWKNLQPNGNAMKNFAATKRHAGDYKYHMRITYHDYFCHDFRNFTKTITDVYSCSTL